MSPVDTYPKPEAMTNLSDREILLLTVQAVHNLGNAFEELKATVESRAPSMKEKQAMRGATAASVAAIVAFIADVGHRLVSGSN